MADGSIRISTKVDTQPAQTDLTKLENECKKTAKEIEKVGEKLKIVFAGASKGQLNSAFKTANKELEKTESALAAVESKIKEIQAGTDKMLPYAATDEQAANLIAMEEQEAAPLLKQREELIAKAAEYKRLMEAITAEQDKQAQLEAAQQALKAGAKDAVADAEWLGKIKNEQEYNAVLEQTQAKMAVIEQEAARIAQLTGVPTNQLLEQNAQYQTLARRASLLVNNQAKFKGKVSDSAAAMKSLEQTAVKTGDKISKSLDKGIKRISKMALGLLGARGAFMALRRAATLYIDANEDLKNQVDGVWNVLAVAIGPVIEKLVGWLTTAISYVNAFVKALWGVDLVAKANALALKKQAKATGDAAKASKQLAGFDEMNKLNDTNTGGSGADSASIGSLQTVPIDTGAVDDFIEKLRIILPIVAAIAAGIAAWKVASFFDATLKGSASWAMIIAGAVLAIWGYCDALVNGLDWGNFALVLAGLGLVVGGLWLQFGKLAGSIGLLVAGISLLVLGAVDFIKNGPSLQNTILIIGGAIATAVALATMGLGPLVAAIIGAVAAVVAFTAAILLEEPAILSVEDAQEALTEAKNRATEAENSYINAVDAAEAAMERLEAAEKAAGMTGKDLYSQVQEGTLDYADMTDAQKELYKAYLDNEQKQKDLEASTKTLNEAKKAETLASLENEIALGKEAGSYDKCKESILAAYNEGAISAEECRDLLAKSMSEMSDDAQQTFMEDIPGDIKDGLDPNKFETTRKKIGDWFSNVGKFITEKIWKPIKDWWNSKVAPIFTKSWWKNKFDAIKEGARSALNGLIGIVESALNFIINKANGLSWDVPDWVPLVGGKKFGFSLPTVKIPRLAVGGIVNRPGRGVPAIIGEAGAEAVLPLENNTEWMDILADKIGGGTITIPISLDGKKIATYVVDIQKKKAFAMNGA